MPAGLTVALALLAQAAADPAYGPAAPDPPKAAAASAQAGERECAQQNHNPDGNSIVICAVRPQGYRLDPDVLEAKRLKKKGDTGRPRSPHETFADHSCANVGPMGCRGVPAVNLLAVAATAAEISKRLAEGKEIGSLFETAPNPSEYQLYQEAKREREAKEAAAKAKAVKEAATAAARQAQPAAASQQ
jgi:hypothetical protein